MNNMNAREYIGLRSELMENSPEWELSLRLAIKQRLTEMQRLFLEEEFAVALQTMDNLKLNLSGVTFLIYLL